MWSFFVSRAPIPCQMNLSHFCATLKVSLPPLQKLFPASKTSLLRKFCGLTTAISIQCSIFRFVSVFALSLIAVFWRSNYSLDIHLVPSSFHFLPYYWAQTRLSYLISVPLLLPTSRTHCFGLNSADFV